MRDVEVFMDAYLDHELAYEKYVRTVDDDDACWAEREKLCEFFDFSPIMSEPPYVETHRREWFEEGKEKIETMQKRVLFLIKQYRHPEYGDLYQCYLGDNRGMKSFFHCFYVATIDGRLKIVSIYFILSRKYEHRQGEEIGSPGTLLAVRKITPPSGDDLEEYNAY